MDRSGMMTRQILWRLEQTHSANAFLLPTTRGSHNQVIFGPSACAFKNKCAGFDGLFIPVFSCR